MTVDLSALIGPSSGPPIGVHFGTVTRVDVAGGVYFTAPRLGTDAELGPSPAAAGSYAPGDRILVAALEDSAEELVVLGRVGAASDPGVDHAHDDRYYTEAEADARYATAGHAHTAYALAARLIGAGTGLTGGGDLTADRTLAVDLAPDGAGTSSQAVRGTDTRLSNARTPTAHVHPAGDVNSGTLDIARIPVAASGVSSATQVPRADDSRLSNARTPTAHTHGAADVSSGTLDIARVPVAASGVSSATQVTRADDSRLSNARTPTAHVHAAADVSSGTLDIARIPVAASGVSSATQVTRADDSRLSNARTPTAHVHAAADVSSGTLDIARVPVAASGTSSATQVTRADDSRLSNARTPTAHKTTHATGGTDALTPADIGAATESHTHPGAGFVPQDTRLYKTGVDATTSSGSHVNQVSFGTLDYNDLGLTTGSSWAVPAAGRYRITVQLAWAVHATGRRSVLVTLNSTAQPGASDASVIAGDNRAASPSGPSTVTATVKRTLAAGDTIRVWASQSSGANLDLTPDQGGCSLLIERTA